MVENDTDKILKEYNKELKNININISIQKDCKVKMFQIPTKMIGQLFDLRYMIDDNTWETLKLNKMDNDIKTFFDIIDKLMDCIHEGKTYEFEDNKIVLSKDRFYHSGKKPKWRNKNEMQNV